METRGLTMNNILPLTKPVTKNLLGIAPEILLKWYDEMLLIRRFEEKCAQLYGMGKIDGFCHLYNGQEAIAAGSIGAITPDDYVITAYRDHGLAISKGVDPRRILAELLGKHTGTTKGKGGSMHLFDREKNFLGGHAIVGGHIPIGTGAAFASKYRGEKRVCLCFMGDGATNIGEFHESLNLAALWKLPVIYIIENNKYGMGTAVDRASAVDHARATYEPSLLEVQTFRYRGHSMSDPIHGHYRTKEEVETQKTLDPLTVCAKVLKEAHLAADEYFESAEKRIKNIVEECVQFTESSPEPPLEELYTDVYADEMNVRTVDE